ncbi:MAG: PqiC family protein [Pseudomonadota bacterium]
MTVFRNTLFFALSTSVTACASSAPPSLYVLDLPAPTRASGAPDAAIGLFEVSLPAYARNPQITTMTDGATLFEDDDHRWANPPAEAISAALARSLEDSFDKPVVLKPYPRGLTPELQLSIAFDHFYRTPSGSAEFGGQFIIIEDDEITDIERFNITATPSNDSYRGYMQSVSAGLERLVDIIESKIEEPPLG